MIRSTNEPAGIRQDSASIQIGARAASGETSATGLIRVENVAGPWTVSAFMDYTENPPLGADAVVTAPGSVVPEVLISYRVGRTRGRTVWTTSATSPVRNWWIRTFNADSIDVSLIVPPQVPGLIVPCTLHAYVTQGIAVESREAGALLVLANPAAAIAAIQAGADLAVPFGAESLEITPPFATGAAGNLITTWDLVFLDITGNRIADYRVFPNFAAATVETARRFAIPSGARFAYVQPVAATVATIVPVAWVVKS